MKSKKARKQRKELFNAPLHRRRKGISAHLEENLLLKYDKRSISVIKGDTIKVMRGSFKGHEDKVAHVNVKNRHLEIEGITLTKADGKKIAKPIHPSNVLITKLNLTDKWRRNKLERGLSEETKKEIEEEAKVQIKEIEEEQKIKEEKIAEIEQKEREEKEPEKKEKEKPEKIKKVEDKVPKKTKPKEDKQEKTDQKKKTSVNKKTTTKKSTTKSKKEDIK